MTSWYSNILTKTSTQISTIRSNLLSSEADGDTEDDTHVCRVLRAYYSEKGRPRPGWLPADPKAAAPAPQPMYAQPQAGSRYGGFQQQGNNSHNQGQGGFSSLWDSNPSQQQPPPQPQSLRAGRAPAGAAAMSSAARPDVQRTASYASQHSNSGGSAQDRLKQRLYGGRGGAAASSNALPATQSQGSTWGSGGDPYSGTGGGQQRQGGLPNGPRGYR